LAGFSKQDQILLATIIRLHRRKFPRALLDELPSPWNVHALYLSLILRLAVLLHRNRHEHELPHFTIAIIKSKIHLQFPADWLNQSPLTHADLIQEADYLKSARFKLEFV
jgi:exopolyphosphatase/guanosine-5'-triphosphate,3'-diphosphate pyrophosphatase